MGSRLELGLLGGWHLSHGGGSIELPPSQQRLVALLALTGQPSRCYVVGLLWPEEPESYGLNNLRALLSRLQQRQSLSGLIRRGGSRLSLGDGVAVDVREMLRRAAALRNGVEPNRLETLTLLSRGDLLPGWYDEWVYVERERLRQVRLHTLELLCDRWNAEGDRAAALDAALIAVRLDPLRESAHRQVVQVHLAEGNVAEALRHFHGYAELIGHELQLSPTHRMRDLVAPFLTGAGGGGPIGAVQEARR